LPQKCSQLEGVFSYTRGWKASEWGAVDGKAAEGKNFTSGEMKKGRKKIYYGYCAKRK